MKVYRFTKILISALLLVTATTVGAETVVSNVVSVSSQGGSDGEASISTSIISTVDGETTEYHYDSEIGTTSVTYTEKIIHDEELDNKIDKEEQRATYLRLIEKLLNLISLLQAKM